MIQTNFGSYAEDVDEQDGIKHLDDPEENRKRKLAHKTSLEDLENTMFRDEAEDYRKVRSESQIIKRLQIDKNIDRKLKICESFKKAIIQ